MAKTSKHRTEQAGGAHTVTWKCPVCGGIKELPAWYRQTRCSIRRPWVAFTCDEGEMALCNTPMIPVLVSLLLQTQRGHYNQARQTGHGAVFYAQRASATDSSQAYTLARLAAREAYRYLDAGGTWPPAEGVAL